MKIKEWLAVVTLISTLLPFSIINADYNQNNAQTFLQSHAESPWSVMALTVLGQTPSSTAFLASVSGTSAVSYEAPILAITALGQNPRTFGSTDYVTALKSYHTNSQIGDIATINDDIFGILALVSAGEPTGDAAIVDAKNFILSHQNNNGGWGYALTSDPDTNITSSAILALLAAGVEDTDSHIQSAVSYLHNSQNSDGGFPYSPGTDSDSSSTAWVIWSLNALDINEASWNKSNNTPRSYLESNQSEQGYFKFQPNSAENGFSAITTAYATIALEGKYLPVRIISSSQAQQKFSFRIEGSAATICSGNVAATTALDVVRNGQDLCGYTYDIKDTNFGPYLDKINSDAASGNTGWMYLVNDLSPNVGAADYNLQANDSVVWYFGDFGWIPTKLNLSSTEVNSNQSVMVTVESFSNNAWSPLSGATIRFGVTTTVSGNDGKAEIKPQDGFYKVYTEKEGYVRSNALDLRVGTPFSSVVNLSVNIKQTNGKKDDTVSFVVTPNALDFGTLEPGTASSQNFTITNNGTVGIHAEAVVSGDEIFTQNLDLNSAPWENFKTDIAKGGNQNVAAALSIPQDYSGNGAKSGQITIWAMAE